MNISNSIFTNNYATKKGGAIYCSGNMDLEFQILLLNQILLSVKEVTFVFLILTTIYTYLNQILKIQLMLVPFIWKQVIWIFIALILTTFIVRADVYMEAQYNA